ncbi:u11/u12 small nuclear ribonucleoprotein 25 kda protein [Anaeramoeba ignava]|uniref:U11/u12 small nuclear ribonucleoprotein 25 kDa protein n=1 Tax=Anaeramoeba ignava TaxID=1746090 RepID=A0A9Q0R6J7_ANAIG|nr:u11/u12 small nuclear ribonucleoprotein 25 kda protein [Anaeramoeba ignava]
MISKNLLNLLKDPIFKDIPQNINIEIIDALIEIEKGFGWILFIEQFMGKTFEIPVIQTQNLKQFKKSFQIIFENSQTNKKIKISWKYIWKHYFLVFKLDDKKYRLSNEDNNRKLEEIGIKNGTIFHFEKRLIRKRNKQNLNQNYN